MSPRPSHRCCAILARALYLVCSLSEDQTIDLPFKAFAQFQDPGPPCRQFFLTPTLVDDHATDESQLFDISIQNAVTSRTKRFAMVCTSLPHGSWVVHERGCGSHTVLGWRPSTQARSGSRTVLEHAPLSTSSAAPARSLDRRPSSSSAEWLAHGSLVGARRPRARSGSHMVLGQAPLPTS